MSPKDMAERLAEPPATWMDAVIVAVLQDPAFYGAVFVAVFIGLALVALWATSVLLRAIDAEHEAKKEKQR